MQSDGDNVCIFQSDGDEEGEEQEGEEQEGEGRQEGEEYIIIYNVLMSLRRVMEMRKEKSRDAARSRRGKENHEFFELSKVGWWCRNSAS